VFERELPDAQSRKVRQDFAVFCSLNISKF